MNVVCDTLKVIDEESPRGRDTGVHFSWEMKDSHLISLLSRDCIETCE
jgi:hypothetical protein